MVTSTTRRDAIIIIEVRVCNPPSSRARSEASSPRASVTAGYTITVTSRSLGSLRLGRRRTDGRPLGGRDARFSPSSMIGSDRCVGFPSLWASGAFRSRSRPPEVHVDGLQRGARFLLAKQGGDGLWRDFDTPAGEASLWPTAFIGTALQSAGIGPTPSPERPTRSGRAERRRRLGLQRGRAQRRRLDGVGAAVPRRTGGHERACVARPAASSATSAPAAAASPPTPSRADPPLHGRGSVDAVLGVVPSAHRGHRRRRLVRWPAATMRPRMRPGGLSDRSNAHWRVELVLVDLTALHHAQAVEFADGPRRHGSVSTGPPGGRFATGDVRLRLRRPQCHCRSWERRCRPEPSTARRRPARPAAGGRRLAQPADHAHPGASRHRPQPRGPPAHRPVRWRHRGRATSTACSPRPHAWPRWRAEGGGCSRRHLRRDRTGRHRSSRDASWATAACSSPPIASPRPERSRGE